MGGQAEKDIYISQKAERSKYEFPAQIPLCPLTISSSIHRESREIDLFSLRQINKIHVKH